MSPTRPQRAVAAGDERGRDRRDPEHAAGGAGGAFAALYAAQFAGAATDLDDEVPGGSAELARPLGR